MAQRKNFELLGGCAAGYQVIIEPELSSSVLRDLCDDDIAAKRLQFTAQGIDGAL